MPPQRKSQKRLQTRRLKIFANDAGQVFLLSRSGASVEVDSPIHEHLEDARNQILIIEKENAKGAKAAVTVSGLNSR